MERGQYINSQQIELLCIEAFKSSGFLIVNKTLIRYLGLLPAIILSNYIDKHIYYKNKYKNNGGWFFLTHQQQMDQLCISEHSLIKWKHFLLTERIIDIEKRGVPAKEWYHINFSKLTDFLQDSIENENEFPDPLNSGGLVPENCQGLYKGDLIRRGEKNIIPPPLNLVIKYCKERSSSVDPKTFFDWHTSKGWIVGKVKMKDWQAAIRTWEQRDKVDKKQFEAKKHPPIFDHNIKYVWDEKIQRYVHCVSREIYIP